MKSKITGNETTFLFKAKVLNKYDVSFFKCNDTGFLQTEEPYWLQEAYSSAITKLDIGLYQRNETLKNRVEKILLKNFNCENKFLDYAGGYGLFTRMMRDKGFDFYHTDKFCQNLFAENFELENATNQHFELVTAFEVFEHMSNPFNEIKDLFRFSKTILFSTELQEDKKYKTVKDWWYFSPETGQHISFFNIQSLEFLASQFGCRFYTDGKNLHLFTKNVFDDDLLKLVRDPFIIRKMKKFVKKHEQDEYKFRQSLLSTDWNFIKDKINSSH